MIKLLSWGLVAEPAEGEASAAAAMAGCSFAVVACGDAGCAGAGLVAGFAGGCLPSVAAGSCAQRAPAQTMSAKPRPIPSMALLVITSPAGGPEG